MSKSNSNTKKMFWFGLATLLVLPLAFGARTTNFAFAQEAGPEPETTYVQVSTLEDLKQKQGAGTNDFEITDQLSITEATTLSGLNLKYNPETAKYMFNISKDASLTLENCKVVGQSKWTLNTEDPQNVTVVAEGETAGKQHFVQGNGNLTLKGCDFKDIYTNGTFVTINGTEEALLDLNVYDCHFEHCAVEGTFFHSNYAHQNWGDEGKTSATNTITNFYGKANGSLLQGHHGELNLYQLNIQDAAHRGNGLVAPENGTKLNIYDGFYMENCRGYYIGGGTFGSLFHMYEGADFNMYGGTIKNCSGVQGIICTGRDDIKFNIYGGKIICDDETVSLVLENATLYIGEDAYCQGNIYCAGVGTMENHGTIKGDIKISGTHPSYPLSGAPAVSNSGKIDGTIDLSAGTLENAGDISGELKVSGGEFTNDKKGVVRGDVTITEDGKAVNNGKIYGHVSGDITGSGKINPVNVGLIVGLCVGGVAILGLIVGIVLFVLKKKKAKV